MKKFKKPVNVGGELFEARAHGSQRVFVICLVKF
jgi:hypothetical protein